MVYRPCSSETAVRTAPVAVAVDRHGHAGQHAAVRVGDRPDDARFGLLRGGGDSRRTQAPAKTNARIFLCTMPSPSNTGVRSNR